MRVHYVRISSIGQNMDRQFQSVSSDILTITDTCSGSIPFFSRPGGGKIKSLMDEGQITQLTVHSIDRICRNLKDFVFVVDYFRHKKINIHFLSQGLNTIDPSGSSNPMTNALLNLIAIFSEVERSIIAERRNEGIALRKAANQYLGRKPGTSEDKLKFLSKEKNQKIIHYLKKGGYKIVEISKLTGASTNTIKKVKRNLNVES